MVNWSLAHFDFSLLLASVPFCYSACNEVNIFMSFLLLWIILTLTVTTILVNYINQSMSILFKYWVFGSPGEHKGNPNKVP